METSTRRELTSFFGWTVAVSWLIWLPGVLTYLGLVDAPAGMLGLLQLVGACVPAVVALILTRRQSGSAGLRAMVRSAFNVRRGFAFWLMAVGLLLALHAVSRGVYALIVSDLPSSAKVTSVAAAIPLFVIMFFVGGGLGEEIGWRGYALDRLQTRFSALTSSLLLGAVWIVWHLPLFWYGGTNQSLVPIWLFIASVLPLSVMLTWVYNNTKTIFAAALFHTVGNAAHELFYVLPTEELPSLSGYVVFTLFYILAAVALVLVFGAKRLRRVSSDDHDS